MRHYSSVGGDRWSVWFWKMPLQWGSDQGSKEGDTQAWHLSQSSWKWSQTKIDNDLPKCPIRSTISSPWWIFALSITKTLRGPGNAEHLGSYSDISAAKWRTVQLLTTLYSKYSRNIAFIIDPLTTVPEMIPSKVSSASIDVQCPQMKGCFFSAHLPFCDLP